MFKEYLLEDLLILLLFQMQPMGVGRKISTISTIISNETDGR